jgi:16S rRNA processing protein RimM
MSNSRVKEDFNICVGVITSVNGVKGHVKIRSFTQKSSDIANFNHIFDPESKKEYKISVVSAKKDYIIAGIEGVNSRNDAERMRNTQLFIKRSELPEAANNDEYYHADLIGIQAKAQDGRPIGVVKNVLNFGAGDVLEIYNASTEKTSYYPFTKQFVPELDVPAGILTLMPLEETLATND